MTAKEQTGGEYVKKETVMIIALIALVVGFLGGVVYSAFKAGPSAPAQTSGPSGQQQAKKPGISPDEAQKIIALEKEVAANPKNLQAWTALGNIYFDIDNAEKAVTAYRKSLELDPNNADVWTDMGVMYRHLNKFPEAIESFDKAVEKNQRHEVARFNKGVVLMHDLKDQEGAIQAWQELLNVNPTAMAPNGMSIKDMIESYKTGGPKGKDEHDH